MLIWLLALAARGAAGASSCSANGALVAGACRCKDGWRGPDCGALDLVDGGRPLWPPASRFGAASSWGASVVAHDGAHWIFVSEMAAGCGLATWRSNSMVVAARSGDGPLGPYAAAEMMIPGTAKSPWILLHIGGYRVEAKRTCGGGVTTPERRRLAGRGARRRPRDAAPVSREGRPAAAGEPGAPPREKRPNLGTRVLVADGPRGPWNATTLACAEGHENCDFANPAMAIDPDTGEALAAYKIIHGPFRGRAIAFARAPSWRGPFAPASRDRWNKAPGIPCGSHQYFACEDPFLWRAPDGVYHVLFHHSDGRTREDLGGHAWSDDGGATWTLSETNAYGNNFTTFDGARHTFKRPQRPQLHVAADGTPLALVLGVAGDSVAGPGSCRPPSSSPGCDRSWTLGVPTSALAGRRADADDEADAPRAAPRGPAAPEPRRKTSFEERHDW
ncbi:hypothetical protein AURANDRAFT_65813 [Aureococcus anophagefferens]|uniref:Integrin beta epidermal growth factor-like domain-containing protein n=1 Tax=Aureococcus anophagefferens TaxID=44056 RepID=F0YFK6_AURAN|nr:hypothetical protein AURANDRAFT_65813 [Aureococcus anophagefferens]EGB06240.1 hypothetical protein AURANDRAFT_65813 [Aureococcus anophagefferens]|eukprot:XP_009039187.1 hypothetical protein AURANDRAFT_65813 [Aureococcus anophagefferens]